VSRVGGNAQIKAMKQVAGTLRLELAQYRELAAFAQFGSDLDTATQRQLARGQRLTEILKQDQYQPMNVEHQVVVIWAASNGYVDDVPVESVRHFEGELLKYLDNAGGPMLSAIREKRQITDEVKGLLRSTLDEFKKRFSAQVKGAVA
jgi:F-type H+/Na+-transporting ATPase subunit alpha